MKANAVKKIYIGIQLNYATISISENLQKEEMNIISGVFVVWECESSAAHIFFSYICCMFVYGWKEVKNIVCSV